MTSRFPPAIDAADALDSSEWFGTGLLGLVSGLAALWSVKAWREWRSGEPALTSVLQLGLARPPMLARGSGRAWRDPPLRGTHENRTATRLPDAQDAIEAIKRENLAPPALVFYVVPEDR